MNGNHHYAFYGSLRKGGENYILYQNDLQYLTTVELQGFKMYSLGEYPYVIRSRNHAHKVVADLFIITNPETERIIYEMEVGAGYIFSVVEVDRIKFGIYLFTHASHRHSEVTTGDWSLFQGISGF